MKHHYKLKLFILFSFLLFIFTMIPQGSAQAYYGYGGSYGLYGGIYGGLYVLGGLRYGLAEQVGIWEGLWSDDLASELMTLNIVQDPIFGTLTGYVRLISNRILPSLVEIKGEILNNQIIASGAGLGIGSTTIEIDLVGTIISATEMTGNYTLIESSSVRESGSFRLTLLNPVI